ncbi:permease of the major facilitator superfamily [Bellilinea caldifistulae]|uniref:MFS transporter n=1 Tax=Bellilinea caldifistulae TaxID=360411 RepID=UPI00078633EA|nr:MFS transporter [Bellilinea caldifistulae]GAP11276.1 permease of the major facilitator superfamily [Bellilinea caldifistulae]
MAIALEQTKTRAVRKRIPTTRRERWAWYFYDFGNSAYAAVVLLAVYSAYFQGQVVGGSQGTRLWGISVGIAMLIVAVLSPILGTLADFSASKKRFLLFFTTLSVIFTAALFFVMPGDIFAGMLFFILAETGYRAAQVFYNALLPEIAAPEEMGKVSGNGWAFGSLGGIVCLLIVLALIMSIGGTTIVRFSFLITAVFYLISSIPLFLWLRERAEPQPLRQGEGYIGVAFRRLSDTFRAVRQYREFIKFIIAFLIYNDGIMMALNFAAIIGAVLFGMTQQQLIVFMIIIQITSVAGAYVFGILADRWSSKRSLIVSLAIMIGAVVWMVFVQNVTVFFVIGAIAGFALTGVQSVSRTLVGQFAPEEKSAEFYGFFEVGGRTSSFIGPAVYGFIAAEAALILGGRGMDTINAEQTGIRIAIGSIVAFLLFGLVLLLKIRQPETEEIGQSSASL